ncbi:hypothetical protein IT568_12775 [bacterium]|nr:hypothetical protein [bacterium]
MKIKTYFLLVFGFCSVSKAEIQWKLRSEFGANLIADSSQTDGIYKFSGEIKYKVQKQNNEWIVKSQLRPEFYGLNTQTLKILTSANYKHKKASSETEGILVFRKYFYSTSDGNFYYNIFELGTNYFQVMDFANLNLGLNYVYRDLNDKINNSFDAIFIECKLLKEVSPYNSINFGVYAENFKIRNQDLSKEKNFGYRLGIETGFSYSKFLAFSSDYRLILHKDEVTKLSCEHWLRLLLGKTFSEKWATFFLVDYYFRDFRREKNTNSNLYYNSIDNEKRFYLKFDYHFSKKLEIYSKFGFLRENLVYKNLSLSGWNGSLGIEWKN